MASRVTASELRKVIEVPGQTDPVSDITLDFHIANASLLVTEHLATVSPALSADRLKLIELYLAAHFYVLTSEQGGIVKEQTGDASRSYNLITDTKGLGSSRFGNLVKQFDTTGILTGLGSGKPPARFQVV